MDDRSAMPSRCHLADKKINTRREYALIFLSVRWHLIVVVLQTLIMHTLEKKQYISLIIDAYLDRNWRFLCIIRCSLSYPAHKQNKCRKQQQDCAARRDWLKRKMTKYLQTDGNKQGNEETISDGTSSLW